MAVTIKLGGTKYHADLLASIISTIPGCDAIRQGTMRRADILYWISGTGPTIREAIFSLLLGKRIIIHWIGSDVLNYAHPESTGFLLSVLIRARRFAIRLLQKNRRIINLAGSPWLVEELREAGIKATYLPITTLDETSIPIESEPVRDIDVIGYAPVNKFTFYHGDVMLSLAEKLPQYNFHIISVDIFSEDDIPCHAENVTFHPMMDHREIIGLLNRGKCLLRLTQHDGLSLAVLEALYCRLHVFWTYPFTGVEQVNDMKMLAGRLDERLKTWRPNDAGHDYVIEHFPVEIWKSRFRAILGDYAGVPLPETPN